MRTTSPALKLAFFVLQLSIGIGQSAVLHVPADYAGIQQAIDASNPGDVVLVSPGLYRENIDFKGKAITLTSIAPDDPTVVQATIIRAAGQGSVVTFKNRETASSVLKGFTITGGYGTLNTNFGQKIYWGGGVYCNQASPAIIGNIIVSNGIPAAQTPPMYGGGVACLESDALVARNIIKSNTGLAGGAMITYLGTPRITSNLICSNSASLAGAVALLGGAQFLNNTVVGNSADDLGNVYGSSDGTNDVPLVANNIICSSKAGAGLYVEIEQVFTVSYNDVWNNPGGNYAAGSDRTGSNGNISKDPLFVDAASGNYRLQESSPCVDAGDPSFGEGTGEMDLYGDSRVYAGRVDIGAAEAFDPLKPRAQAGPDQLIPVSVLPLTVSLDGSGSVDPNGAALSYEWTQTGGPAVSLIGGTTAKPSFTAAKIGQYVFELVVRNGQLSSSPDIVRITLQNGAPVADAGFDQTHSESAGTVTLDGSRSLDPENVTLSYRWKQVGGWKVQLVNPSTATPSFTLPWPGSYVFELVVNDGLQDSQPDLVRIVVGPNHAPVADAGPGLYVATGQVTLDGTRSYDPDAEGELLYSWRQVSGPKLSIGGTNDARPGVTGLSSAAVQKCVFELVVSDGELVSQPSRTIVTVVPNYGSNALVLVNPPFDTARPTILAFGGGNCSTGSGMSRTGVWSEKANWITVQSYDSAYTKYGNMLMVYLSAVAPDYKQAIQTAGFSTGNKPAMEVACYVNSTYKDARYAVNRVSLLDAVCNNLQGRVSQFHALRIEGEQCWIDNYISNDPGYSKAAIMTGALNVTCNPARNHGYPPQRYFSSSRAYGNGGRTAFGYLSVIGEGKNYQLNTAANKYFFRIDANESLIFYSQASYPGKILAPVKLTGPADGAILSSEGAVLTCEPVENAVGYQLLFGFDPDRVMDFTVVSDGTNPPAQTILTLPQRYTWWTVKAYDQYNSTIHADPQLIRLPDNRAPVADGGPDRVVYAGVDRTAEVSLDASNSSDPEGHALSHSWAWSVNGALYQSNGVALNMNLPVGAHAIQLMVGDGEVNSEPDEVNVTVVAPLECTLEVVPHRINWQSNTRYILAALRFPPGITATNVKNPQPVLLAANGSHTALRWWVTGGQRKPSLFAMFDKQAVAGLNPGPTELKVAGKLANGRWFYGTASVNILRK